MSTFMSPLSAETDITCSRRFITANSCICQHGKDGCIVDRVHGFGNTRHVHSRRQDGSCEGSGFSQSATQMWPQISAGSMLTKRWMSDTRGRSARARCHDHYDQSLWLCAVHCNKSRQHKLENKAKQKQNGHWRTPTVLVDLNTQQIQEHPNKQPNHENIPLGSSACSTHDSNAAPKKTQTQNIARNAVGKNRTKQTDSKTTSNVV